MPTVAVVTTGANLARVRREGRLWCAEIGATGMGLTGWGDTPAEALLDLAFLCHALHWTFVDDTREQG